MALSEKVAYLAGLKEGLNLDETRPELNDAPFLPYRST